MHRFYIEPGSGESQLIELSEREMHHATRVLRLRLGDQATCLDGTGNEYSCQVHSVGRNSVQLQVLQRKHIPALPYQLTLVQAIPKGKTMETIVQKATELGAFRIVPILAERCVMQLEEDNSESKLEKWNWIAIDAIKQCGSPWLPRIEKPIRLGAFLQGKEPVEISLLASLHEDVQHPRAYFRGFENSKGNKPITVDVWVGPEGDFTPAEISAIRASGASPITLGPLVLRSDTAAIYCLSVLNYELQAIMAAL
ncbi:MAG: RsmE family RNA methyltransferase [Verrucomicrobiales bacterium]